MATSKFPPKLELGPGVLDAIETHAYSNLTAEVGGMLVGDVKGGVTEIVGYVPATTASAEQISLTFTHDVWAEILSVVNKDFPEYRIVGWYHTHPSFGLFLSQYDEFIQQNFFGDTGQVALVIDPIAGELAWFAARGKKIEEFGRTATRRGPTRRPETHPAENGRRSNPLKTVLIAAGAAALSGALVWGLTQIMLPPDTTNALKESKQANQNLEASLNKQMADFAALLSSPVLVYEVVEGDDLSSIVLRFYRTDESAMVLQVNGLDSADQVTTGKKLLLPNVPNIMVYEMTNEQLMPPTPAPTPTPTATSGNS